MKIILAIALIFSSSFSFGQYVPRGVSLNDGYLPNLDEPDKWILGIDGIFDWQKEDTTTTSTSYQLTRSNLNLMYGGQSFRGGLQVIHDFSRDVKDLSIGLGFTYNRPFFFEAGAGYLQRLLSQQSFDGWSYNAKVGYYVNWVMHIKYRFRIRMAFAVNYKTINSSAGDLNVLHFYPLLGLEFET